MSRRVYIVSPGGKELGSWQNRECCCTHLKSRHGRWWDIIGRLAGVLPCTRCNCRSFATYYPG